MGTRQLSYPNVAKISCKIATFPGTIARLVAPLAEDVNPDIQESAAWAIGRIACGAVERGRQVASFPKAMGRVLELPSKDGSPTEHD